MAKFQVGHLVRLKSGGPVMTVTSINDTSLTCEWFHQGDVRKAAFPEDSLMQHEDPKPFDFSRLNR